mgnify:CR=1 FL=1
MADAMAGLRRASPGATEALGPGPQRIAVSRTRTGRAVQVTYNVYMQTPRRNIRALGFTAGCAAHASVVLSYGLHDGLLVARGVFCDFVLSAGLSPRVLVLRLSFNLMFNLHHTTCSCTCFTNPPPTPVHPPFMPPLLLL